MKNISKSMLEDVAIEKQKYNSNKIIFTTIDR